MPQRRGEGTPPYEIAPNAVKNHENEARTANGKRANQETGRRGCRPLREPAARKMRGNGRRETPQTQASANVRSTLAPLAPKRPGNNGSRARRRGAVAQTASDGVREDAKEGEGQRNVPPPPLARSPIGHPCRCLKMPHKQIAALQKIVHRLIPQPLQQLRHERIVERRRIRRLVAVAVDVYRALLAV